MPIERNFRPLARTAITGVTLLAFGVVAMLFPFRVAQSQPSSELELPDLQSGSTGSDAHMPEEFRSEIRKVVVIAGEVPADEEITGSYEKKTPGLIGGMESGRRMGTITKEVGGVPVHIPIPILQIPGAIFGGLSGAAKREIQDFRDELTDELAAAEKQPLTNYKLALDVYRELGRLPNLDSKLFAPTTPVPEDTDAILYASLTGLAIEVEGKEAILTTSAKMTLRRLSDHVDLYVQEIQYKDRDTLSNWTENDNALWRDYANFARHYLGREISAKVFGRVELQHELLPNESDTAARAKKDERQFVSRSSSPTLAWELTVAEDNAHPPWTKTIDESAIYYDVEIYDMHRPVYSQKRVQDPHHTIAMELPCQTYRWSVRPSYHIDGDIKFGQWMRIEPETDAEADTEAETGDGIVGRKASEAPAYIQDFALLEIKCGRKKRR